MRDCGLEEYLAAHGLVPGEGLEGEEGQLAVVGHPGVNLHVQQRQAQLRGGLDHLP